MNVKEKLGVLVKIVAPRGDLVGHLGNTVDHGHARSSFHHGRSLLVCMGGQCVPLGCTLATWEGLGYRHLLICVRAAWSSSGTAVWWSERRSALRWTTLKAACSHCDKGPASSPMRTTLISSDAK